MERLLLPRTDTSRTEADLRAAYQLDAGWVWLPSVPTFVRGGKADEIASFVQSQPNYIDGREVMRRLSPGTHLAIEKLALQDANVCKLWNTLKAGGPVDVHSVEFQQGAAYLKSVGIPRVWASEAAFTAEVAVVTA